MLGPEATDEVDIQRNSVKSGEGCRKGAQRQALQGRRRPQVETLPPVICWRKCFYAVAINVYCNACELVPGLQRRRRLSQSVVLLAAPSLSPMSLLHSLPCLSFPFLSPPPLWVRHLFLGHLLQIPRLRCKLRAALPGSASGTQGQVEVRKWPPTSVLHGGPRDRSRPCAVGR